MKISIIQQKYYFNYESSSISKKTPFSRVGYTIQPHFGGVMKSKKYWGEDALEFRPERYFNNEKNQFIRDERIVPFSVGKSRNTF